MNDTFTDQANLNSYPATRPETSDSPSFARHNTIARRRRLAHLAGIDSSSLPSEDSPLRSDEADTETWNRTEPLQPQVVRTLERFQTLQSWEGVITEVLATYFVARVIEKNSEEEEEAEIPIAEISPVDRGLLEVGNRFYWAIGYRQSTSGQRSRESLLLLRRRPVAKTKRLTRADAWVNKVEGSWLSQT